MKTGFLYHEIYMWHDTLAFGGILPMGMPIEPYRHFENSSTKRRLRNVLEVSGLLKQLVTVEARHATKEEICRFHTSDYYEKIKDANDLYGAEAGILTPMGRGSFDIATLAAGGAIVAADAVLSGRLDNVYALVRPPGHHALSDTGMGFCIFGNAVIAAKHLMEVRRVRRIAIVDWDVHHGNGTQAAFFDNPNVLTISVHQDRCFPPDSGYMSEIGEGAGEGFNMNIPLPPGSGIGAYEATYERVIVPALRAFRPEIIIVPSGFDAGGFDPLGRQIMTSGCYRSLTRMLMEVANDVCGGRLVMLHEGGYDAVTVPFYGLAVIEELSGIKTEVDDPFEPIVSALGGQELQPHQEAVIDQAAGLLTKLKG